MNDFELGRLENLINEIVSCCEERTDKESKRFGVPYAEIQLLRLIGQDRYATVTGLSSRFKVAKSRVTKLLGGLLNKGLVSQVDDPKDKRVKLFGLTAKGRELLREILDYERNSYGKLLLFFRPEERDLVLRSLDLLHAAMEKVKGEL